jgi:hypothetical protein
LHCLLIQQYFFLSLREISCQWLEIHSLETCISSSSVSCFSGIISAASYLCGKETFAVDSHFIRVVFFTHLFSSKFYLYLFVGYLMMVISFKITFF